MNYEFRTYHLGVVDLLERAEELETEQTVLDDHTDRITRLLVHLECLVMPGEGEEKCKPNPKRSLQRKLLHLEGNLQKASDAVTAMEDKLKVGRCVSEQYDEQQNGFKLKLYDMSQSILSMDGDVFELLDHEARISKAIFGVCLKIR